MASQLEGNVRLIPMVSDACYRLLLLLIQVSNSHPQDIAPVLGALIVGAAGVEGYLNELIEFGPLNPDDNRNQRLRRELLAEDPIDKLRRLRELAASPDMVLEELVDDVRMLLGLRGLLAHYQIQKEHPTETRTSLQRLKARLRPGVAGEIALDALLTPETATWVRDIMYELVKQLYAAGYEPPRPRWVELVDPTRFGAGNRWPPEARPE